MSKLKRIMALVLCVVLFLAGCSNNKPVESDTDNSDSAVDGEANIETARSWLETQIENNTLFSFEYDGKPYSEFIGSWEKSVETGTNDDGLATWTVTYVSPEKVTAWAEISLDEEYSALDWCCYFRNDAGGDSPVISNIQAMDSAFKIDSPVLTTAQGSLAKETDFEPFSVDLTETPEYSTHNMGGRSSQSAFPFFDISNGKIGILCAIGWTGSWAASFANQEGSVSMTAGMQNTNIALHADEQMRTPSIVLTFFTGDQDAGHNQFRQLVLKSYTPLDEDGEPLKKLPIILNCWGGAGANSLLSDIDAYDAVGIDFDLMWVDAGWYGDYPSINTYDSVWSTQVGNWYPYEKSYPNGFVPVSEKLHEDGRKLMVWFEPERAMDDTMVLKEHPEYFFLSSEMSFFNLIDYSQDEATDYIIELLDGLVTENGIDWIRQDFNCDPSPKWFTADNEAGADRKGMTEIKYITNLYRMLDTLIERHPGLVFDNCAAGGRRIDIEMMKRSVPLWRTDYTVTGENNSSNADGVRSIGYNLSWWLPLSTGGSGTDGHNTTYTWRCLYSAGIFAPILRSDRAWRTQMLEQYNRCRDLMTGDYYILTAGLGSNYNKDNAVYEYYVPEKGEGYVIAFRPAASTVDQETHLLKGLEAEANYVLEVADSGETLETTGAELMEKGLSILLENPASSQIVYITKQ